MLLQRVATIDQPMIHDTFIYDGILLLNVVNNLSFYLFIYFMELQLLHNLICHGLKMYSTFAGV